MKNKMISAIETTAMRAVGRGVLGKFASMIKLKHPQPQETQALPTPGTDEFRASFIKAVTDARNKYNTATQLYENVLRFSDGSDEVEAYMDTLVVSMKEAEAKYQKLLRAATFLNMESTWEDIPDSIVALYYENKIG